MSNVGMYRHLDKTDPFTVKLDSSALAKQLVQMNYGVHRLLSELVVELRADQARKEQDYRERFPDRPPNGYPEFRSELADGLEEMLNKGYFK